MNPDIRAAIAEGLTYLERATIALESIAQSLEKLALPVAPYGRDMDGRPTSAIFRVEDVR